MPMPPSELSSDWFSCHPVDRNSSEREAESHSKNMSLPLLAEECEWTIAQSQYCGRCASEKFTADQSLFADLYQHRLSLAFVRRSHQHLPA